MKVIKTAHKQTATFSSVMGRILFYTNSALSGKTIDKAKEGYKATVRKTGTAVSLTN
jgi:hypothetical protein